MDGMKLIFLVSLFRIAHFCKDKLHEGECQYLWFGGVTHLHYYICCNNCHGKNLPECCDGQTYQSASTINYCGSCGRDKGGGICGEQFRCGGCDGQAKVEKKCKDKFKKFNFPGTCFVFAGCMKNRCKQKFSRLEETFVAAPSNNAQWDSGISDENQSVRLVSTNEDEENDHWCGDGVCDPDESVEDCPMDCCQLLNEKCSFKNSTCPPACCNENSCCTQEMSNFGGFYQVDGCFKNNLNNPYTNEQNCPLGYAPYKAARFLAPESKCGADVYLCLSSISDPQNLFGGFYEVTDGENPADIVKNPVTLNLTCPTGFTVHAAGRITTAETQQWGGDLFICLNDTADGVIGGTYQTCDGPVPKITSQHVNWKTHAYSCPVSYKPYQYGRVFAPGDNVGSNLFICLNNVP